MKRFEGKGAVVTGAGRGIGRATAECFAEEGAGVVLFGWHADMIVVDGGYSVGLPVPGVLDEPLVPGGVR